MKVVQSFALLTLVTLASACGSALAAPAASGNNVAASASRRRRLATTGFQQVGSALFGHPSYNESGRGKVQFGSTVALASDTGTRLVVGAPFHDFKDDGHAVANVDGGAILLYELNSEGDWDSENPLWSLYGEPDEKIGEHLSLSGDGTRLAVLRKNPSAVEVYDVPLGSMIGSALICTDGSVGDAVSISPSGTRVALSCLSPNGSVEIFEVDDNDAWNSIGLLEGQVKFDRFGFVTAFSTNGDRLAVSSPNHDAEGVNSGMVQVFLYDSTGGTWVQLGNDMLGTSALGQFGFAMDFSGDGSSVAVSAPNAVGSDGFTSRAGQVSVWSIDVASNKWIQAGTTVFGSSEDDRLGRSISISADHQHFAVGSWAYSTARGLVLLFEFDTSAGDWIEIASATGEKVGDRLASGRFSVSLSGDGQRLAAGEAFTRNDDLQDTGRVVVFDKTDVTVNLPPLDVTEPPTLAPTVEVATLAPTPATKAPTTLAPTESTPSPTTAPTVTQDTPSPTKVPTAVPTSVPTVPDVQVSLSALDWDLEHIDSNVRFSDEAEGEVVMTYDVHRRDVSVQIFQSDCRTPVPETVVSVSHKTIPASANHDTLEITMDIHHDQLVGSPIYSSIDNENGLFELCTLVELLTSDGTPVVFHELMHAISVSLTAGFITDIIDVERLGATQDEFSVDLEYAVSACKCDENFECDEDSVVSQNEIVNICVETGNSTLYISGIRSLELRQDSLSHATIVNSEAGEFTSVILQPDGDGKKAVIQTILFSSFFASEEPADVVASGSVTVAFANETGDSRNLRAEMNFGSRDLLENEDGNEEEINEAGYEVSFAITNEPDKASSASATALSVAFVALLAGTFTLL